MTYEFTDPPELPMVVQGRIPIKAWIKPAQIEDKARAQLLSLAEMPFVKEWLAVMPDVHWGNGTSVGTVFASKGALIPSAIGVDIGCGMAAARLEIDPKLILDKLPEIRHEIERMIPVGFNSRKEESVRQKGAFWKDLDDVDYVDAALQCKAQLQRGTLGGGNHFIEVSLDEEGHVWVFLHSGSRNIGKTLAERHIENAKKIAARYMIPLPDPELAYLADQTPEFGAYIRAMSWCQKYAAENRAILLFDTVGAIVDTIYGKYSGMWINMPEIINCHHNYVAKENHFGQNLWITRKGAVRAREGDLGLIPGSMGTKSYIVRGKGNKESFESCSHGAGRRMGRKEAKRRFTVDDLILQTTGVECRKDSDVIEEIPEAYKDIDTVIELQKDLVDVVHVLKAVLCVKG